MQERQRESALRTATSRFRSRPAPATSDTSRLAQRAADSRSRVLRATSKACQIASDEQKIGHHAVIELHRQIVLEEIPPQRRLEPQPLRRRNQRAVDQRPGVVAQARHRGRRPARRDRSGTARAPAESRRRCEAAQATAIGSSASSRATSRRSRHRSRRRASDGTQAGIATR